MPQNQPVRIFLADRFSHFRDIVKRTLHKKTIEVIGESDTAEGLLDELEFDKPDLLITAQRLNDEDADYFLPLIKERYPDIKILLVTMNCHKEIFLRYVNYLDGMLCKMALREELSEAVFDITQRNKLYFRVDKYHGELKDQRPNKLR